MQIQDSDKFIGGGVVGGAVTAVVDKVLEGVQFNDISGLTKYDLAAGGEVVAALLLARSSALKTPFMSGIVVGVAAGAGKTLGNAIARKLMPTTTTSSMRIGNVYRAPYTEIGQQEIVQRQIPQQGALSL